MSKYDGEWGKGYNRQRQPHKTGYDTERRGNESVSNVVSALRARDLIARPFIPCITGVFPTKKFDSHDREGIDAWMDIVEDDRDFTDIIGVSRLAAQIKSSERGEREFVSHHAQKLTRQIGTGRVEGEYGMMLFNGQNTHQIIRRDFGVELLQIAGIGSNPAHRDVQDFLRLCLHPDLAKDVSAYLSQLRRRGNEDPHVEMYRGANIFQRLTNGGGPSGKRR